MNPACRTSIRFRTGIAVRVFIMMVFAGSAGAQTPTAQSLELHRRRRSSQRLLLPGHSPGRSPKLTLQPYSTLGVALSDHMKASVGVWDSLNTGTSGNRPPLWILFDRRPGERHRGVLVAVGSWDLHGGVNVLTLGQSRKPSTKAKESKSSASSARASGTDAPRPRL